MKRLSTVDESINSYLYIDAFLNRALPKLLIKIVLDYYFNFLCLSKCKPFWSQIWIWIQSSSFYKKIATNFYGPQNRLMHELCTFEKYDV